MSVRRNVCFAFLSVSLIIFSLVILITHPFILDCALSIKCNKVLYEAWRNVPKDVQTEVYLFNWTNPDDIYNASSKLRFQEVGPFRYLQKEKKVNIVWNQNDTITYQQQRFWFYETSKENKNLDQNITSVDPQLMGISYVTRFWNYFVRKGAFLTLATFFPKVSLTRTARKLLFDGYPIPLMKIARALPFFKGLNLPPWDRFGWIYMRNASCDADGTFNMGIGGSLKYGELYNWNYRNETQFYNNECNKISGSAGQLYPKHFHENFMNVFSTDLSRRVKLKFDKKERVHGIVGHKYIADNIMFDNGTIDPENKCFCTGECIPSGVMNVSLSRFHAPVFASLPHFYKADRYYHLLLEGLTPNKEKHDFYVIIEPTTGIILKVDAKLQVNLLLQPISAVSVLEDVPKVYVPVIWVRQKMDMTNTEVLVIKFLVLFPTINIILGLILILISIILVCKITKKKKIHLSQQKEYIECSVKIG